MRRLLYGYVTLHLATQGSEHHPVLSALTPPYPIPSRPQDLQSTLLPQIYPDDGNIKFFRNVSDYLLVAPRTLKSSILLSKLVKIVRVCVRACVRLTYRGKFRET